MYYPSKDGNPSGWRLKNVETPYSQLGLTKEGRKLVLALESPKELFIVSELSFDLLYNRLQSSKLISTAELIRRLQEPGVRPGHRAPWLCNICTRGSCGRWRIFWPRCWRFRSFFARRAAD